MKITLYILGGKTGQEALTDIGASCYLLVIEVYGQIYCYLIDSGMESNDDEAVTYAGPKDIHILQQQQFLIDAVLVSHAHRDHAAALATKAVTSRLKGTPEEGAPVISTLTTSSLLPFVLHDQVKVSGKRKEKLPYGQYEVHQIKKRAARGVVNEPRNIELVPGTIWVRVRPSAHIRGACSFIFIVKVGKRVVRIKFSGDYAVHSQLTTMGAPLPVEDDDYPDFLIFDCTNGGEDLTQGRCSEEEFWQYEMTRMADDNHNTVKAGGKAFDFAFSMDRSPTFARKLADLGLPVWLDGPSAIKLSNRMGLPEGSWCDRDLPVDMGSVRIAEHIFQPLDDSEPCAIVAPGGMGHGPAVEYFKRLLPQENCLVGSSGYQAHGTNGWRLGKTKRGEKVRLATDTDEGPVEVTVAARVEKYRATAHSLRGMAAKRIEHLLSRSQFLKSGTPILGLCHGATPALDWFERRFGGMKTFRQDRPEDRKIVLVE